MPVVVALHKAASVENFWAGGALVGSMRKKLPVLADDTLLDRIGIARPCDAEWDSMKGNEQVRHCPACRLKVEGRLVKSR